MKSIKFEEIKLIENIAWISPESDRVVSIEFQIQVVESLALAAIDLVNPLANPGFLIEHGPVQTEELYVHNLVWNQVSWWRTGWLFGDALFLGHDLLVSTPFTWILF